MSSREERVRELAAKVKGLDALVAELDRLTAEERRIRARGDLLRQEAEETAAEFYRAKIAPLREEIDSVEDALAEIRDTFVDPVILTREREAARRLQRSREGIVSLEKILKYRDCENTRAQLESARSEFGEASKHWTRCRMDLDHAVDQFLEAAQ